MVNTFINTLIHQISFPIYRLTKPLLLLASVFMMITHQACVPTKKLGKEEYLLFNQTIKGTNKLNTEELEAFYRQKTNRKILYMPIMPYLSAYYLGKKGFDKHLHQDTIRRKEKIALIQQEIDAKFLVLDSLRKQQIEDTFKLKRKIGKLEDKRDAKYAKMLKRVKEGNWLMSSVGEPPSIFNKESLDITLEQMNRYLQHKGFFAGSVSANLDTAGKKIAVTYQVVENQPHLIDSLTYGIQDSSMLHLVRKDSVNSLLQLGDQFDESKLEKERIRLLRLMKDNGYYTFVKAFIFFEVDTLRYPYQAHIKTIIRDPPNGGKHRVYRIDEVVVETDVDINRQRTKADTVNYQQIIYIQETQKYSAKVLDRKVFIRKDSLYSQTVAEETQKAFANLNIFKFVNIKYDTVGGGFKANIFSQPYPKYQLSGEFGLNLSQSLPGPFLSGSFITRNIFGGADILELRVQFGVEAQAGATDENANFQSLQWGANASFSFPRIMFPIPLKWKKKVAYRAPKTLISGGYSFVDRLEYNRKNIQGAISYQWLNKKNAQFSLSLLDLSVVSTPRIDSSFQARLDELFDQGNTIKFSFDNSLITSTIFTYTKTGNTFRDRKFKYTRLYLESGGGYLNLLNQTFLIDSETIFGLRFYRFYKFSVDQRLSWPIGKNGQLASRIHAGFAKPYGSGTNVLPYEKYFFSGGSNSNRAWRARRVGPGSFTPELTDEGVFDYRFEQNGEILLEANLELRGHLFSYFDYALFIDASNVWMTSEDVTRPGAQFEINDFWSEMAVGAGIGFRLDFSFLLMRLDIGTKIFDPARPRSERYIGNKINWQNPFGEKGQTLLNIGIGYPF
ncbi:MAG: BamA/TamA family outer membrane protein [Flammeovirgaceae bacterium]